MARYMQAKHDFDYPDLTVHRGTILEIEDEPADNNMVFILDGVLKGRSVHVSHLKDADLGSIVEELRKAEAANLRLKGDFSKLNKENVQLKKMMCDDAEKFRSEKTGYIRERDEFKIKLEIANEGKQVVLPTEVAEAIEFVSTFCSPFILHRAKEMSEKYDELRVPLKVIDEYVFTVGYIKYFSVLVNGYTVEKTKTKEERLREGIEKILRESDPMNLEELSNSLNDFVIKFNAEN